MTSLHLKPFHRTRIKICGLTRREDVESAVESGVDAVGFVMYESSPRAVTASEAADLVRNLPPFVTPVLLFVNARPEAIHLACNLLPTATLQFHGDDCVETPEFCASFGRSFIKAIRLPLGKENSVDLIKYARSYHCAQALLLDSFVANYGGSGTPFNWGSFDWPYISKSVGSRFVLSGGLTFDNVKQGIRLVEPYAVDVSSGVESAKGLKDHQKIIRFVHAVHLADMTRVRASED